MDAATPKPRVNGSMIPKRIGQYVCIVGKNLGVGAGGASLQLETSDKQKLTVHFPQPVRDPLTPYIEVLGKVEPDCSVTAERFVNFGADFDLESYNELVQLTSHFPGIFPHPSGQPMQYQQ